MNGAQGGVGGQEFLRRVIAEIDALPGGGLLTIVDVGTHGVMVWEVIFDEAGSTQRSPEGRPWGSMRDGQGRLLEAEVVEFSEPRDRDRFILVRSGADGPDRARALRALEREHRGVRQYECGSQERVDSLLAEAMASARLRQRYDLVVLRQGESGLLQVGLEKLFSAGVTREDFPRTLSVRIEPGGPHGTSFIVVASDDDRDREDQWLISSASGVIPLGPHDLTAHLIQPGEVRFELDGRPLRLTPDTRPLPEIRAAVPGRLKALGLAHLIVLIETCGPLEVFRQRVETARRLLALVADESDQRLSWSVIAYAAHAHSKYRKDRDLKVDELCWADAHSAAVAALDRLDEQDPATEGHPAAAKLECALAHLAGLLPDAHVDAALGRPVVVTIGSRGAYPHERDLGSQVLPCPQGHNWRQGFDALRKEHPGIAFGAIHDGSDPDQEIWRHLGAHATGRLDAVAMQDFAVALGLARSAAQYIPFPLIDKGRR